MATEVLACIINSLGSWTNVGGADATISVAKPDDEDTSYVTIIAGIDTAVLYDVANTALTTETINSVTVRSRQRILSGSDTGSIQMSDDSFVSTVSSSPSLNASYADSTACTSTTAPSGGAWTVAKLNSLQVKVIGLDVSITRLTSLTVEVSYTTASGATAVKRRIQSAIVM